MLDTKDFSLKSLLKEDRATFIGTALCPIITLLMHGEETTTSNIL